MFDASIKHSPHATTASPAEMRRNEYETLKRKADTYGLSPQEQEKLNSLKAEFETQNIINRARENKNSQPSIFSNLKNFNAD